MPQAKLNIFLIAFVSGIYLSGCSEPQPPLNSSTDITETTQSVSNCDATPSGRTVYPSDELITLDPIFEVVNESIPANTKVAYKVSGKEGQSVEVNWSGSACFSLYAPKVKKVLQWNKNSNEVVTFPENGTYLMLISSNSTAATFSLSLKLNELVQASAVSLVNRWLVGKQSILAAPWDQVLAEELTAGSLRYDLLGSDGSIAWLRKYNAKYKFKASKIENIIDFSGRKPNPSITLDIFEDRELIYEDGSIDPLNSSIGTSRTTYIFTEDNDNWKISDYCETQKIVDLSNPQCPEG